MSEAISTPIDFDSMTPTQRLEYLTEYNARLSAENAALKARNKNGGSLKVSEKGGVSVYGLGRFPVTLYKEQWTKLLDMAEDIRTFLQDHDSELSNKEDRQKEDR